MKKFLLVLLLSVSTIVLASCGKDSYTDVEYTCSQDYGGETLYFLNWGEYMDRGLVSRFEKLCNAKVVYEEVTSNEEFRNKLNQGVTKYDLMTPSDWMVDYLRTNNDLKPINFDNVPNFVNIDSQFKNVTSVEDTSSNISYDPGNVYSIPYFWGTVGIMYNKDVLDSLGVTPAELSSWDILWDSRLKDQIEIYDSQRDMFMFALMSLGYSPNTTSHSEIDAAKQKLIDLKPSVYAFAADQIKSDVANGDVAVGVTFSGDYFDQLFSLLDSGTNVANEADNPIGYVIPDEGTDLWVDNFVIPKTAEHQRLAEEFMNFFLEAKVGYYNTKYVGYSTPNKEAYQLLLSDKDFGPVVQMAAYFPTSSSNLVGFQNSEVYKNLDQDTLDYITSAYEAVIGS